MPGYATRQLTLHVGGHDYRLRALSDRQQFADPNGAAESAGIPSALWCLFGQPWPSGRVLAEAMSTFDITGKRYAVTEKRSRFDERDVEPFRGRLLSCRRDAASNAPGMSAP